MNYSYGWAIVWVVLLLISLLGDKNGESTGLIIFLFGGLAIFQFIRGSMSNEDEKKREQDQIESHIRNTRVENKKQEANRERAKKAAETKRRNKLKIEEKKLEDQIERDKYREEMEEDNKKWRANRERAKKERETKRRNKLEIEKKKLEEAQEKIISKLDKAGTGVVDEIENNDEFKKLLNKYEKEIAEIDRKHIKDFVKLSSYLKTKEKNIQSIFSSIKDTANKKELEEYVGILKNEIHSYKLILYNSLNMIVALVEDKPIIFYEIYESFDKLDVFNSNYENEVSKKLSNIGDGLNDLMYSIHQMGIDIVAEIGNLSYVTEDSSRMLAEKLEEVDSSVKTNNLLTGIQTYQLYELNKSNRNQLYELNKSNRNRLK